MKKCSKCGVETDSRRGICKPCWAAYMRGYYARNPEKAKAGREQKKRTGQKKEHDQRYQQKHREKILAKKRIYNAEHSEHHKVKAREWYLANRERMLKLCKEAAARRKAADPEGFRKKNRERARERRKQEKWLIHSRMSSLVFQYLKRRRIKKERLSWETIVGYTVEQLIDHLKQTVPAGYTWDDYLKGTLELDHIVPVNSFDFKSVRDQAFARCWAMSNLRLLTREENLKRRY